jgi:hypothetical protein
MEVDYFFLPVSGLCGLRILVYSLDGRSLVLSLLTEFLNVLSFVVYDLSSDVFFRLILLVFLFILNSIVLFDCI